ncbi:MAG: DNA primase [Armatimonadetes bacterium]|nr:DNA primase [Armatimonadota bacterium]
MPGGGWDLEEIRRRANIVDLVSPHVRLRKAGRRLVGLCPFHQEKTGSFTVDPEEGLWHCFGCKAGGDIFRFVEMIEKVDFKEAVELLARRLGLPPPTQEDSVRARARNRLLELHEHVAKLFHSALKGKAGGQARSYLRERGVSEKAINEFQLGYAPDSWDALLTKLEKQGYSGKELARAGLAVPRREGGGFYDRFRNRLIFPIRDVSGRVIAFGGRALAEDQQPKYLNSPETPLFSKGRVLYAFDQARYPMAEAGRAIIVEGYLDAISCHEAGFRETVATMGTALTSEHVNLLRRRTDALVLAFDSDSAGLAAALRGRELFARASLDVRVVTMPEGMDPDNVIRDRGTEAFHHLVDDAEPMLEWEMGRLLSKAEDERGKMKALRDAVAVLAQVSAGVEREYYIEWLARRASADAPDHLQSMEAAIRAELRSQSSRSQGVARRSETGSPRSDEAGKEAPERPIAGRLPRSVLAAFVQHGDLTSQYLPMLETSDFPDESQKVVFGAMAALVDRDEPINAEAVRRAVGEEARGLLAELALAEIPEERVDRFLSQAVGRLVESRLRRRRRALNEQLIQAKTDEERDSVRRELADVARRWSELTAQRVMDVG